MPTRRRWLFLSRTALLLGGAALSGCHHLEPPPVVVPPPPPVVCSAPVCDHAAPPRLSEFADTAAAEPQPIDLPTALRLANVQNPEIALARERIREALAVQDRAEVLWLPNVEFGPTWTR